MFETIFIITGILFFDFRIRASSCHTTRGKKNIKKIILPHGPAFLSAERQAAAHTGGGDGAGGGGGRPVAAAAGPHVGRFDIF